MAAAFRGVFCPVFGGLTLAREVTLGSRPDPAATGIHSSPSPGAEKESPEVFWGIRRLRANGGLLCCLGHPDSSQSPPGGWGQPPVVPLEETNNFSFGVTLGYKVKWFPEHNEALQRIETTTENEIAFNVSEKAYVILVKAYNSAGLSPEARLRIPAIAEKTQKIIDYIQILKKNETMTLKWNTTGSRAHRFVVDWCIDSENEPCNISWEYVENVTEWTAQQGIFEPYRCYNISIYPFVKERVESPSHIQVYFKERAPAHGPNLKTERLRKTEVTLNWEAIPKEERNGFIMNYTIIYKPINGINGRQSDVTVDSDTYEYTLRSLMPNTQYTAYIIARNQAGNASGNPINFSTLKYDKGDVGVLIVPVGICIFLILLLLLATCARRNQRLRRFCWPDVPNPAESTMADWPSDWPQIHLEIFEVESDGLVELACIYTSDPVYINEKATLLEDSDEKTRNKAPLKNMHFPSNAWIYKDQQTKTSSGSSPIQYAATHHSCQLTDLFGIIETPTQSSQEDRRPLLCDLCTDGHEKLEILELHEFSEEIAFKPYLKNSVKTRENQAYGNNSGTCNGTVSQLVDEQKDLGQVYVTIDALQHNVKSYFFLLISDTSV
ncbi:interleukin-31 receptor subunit alpha-like [Discoglossus pictus]